MKLFAVKNPWDFGDIDKKEEENNQPKIENFDFNKIKKLKPYIGFILTIVLVIWLFSGIYRVETDENAVVTYFGKFNMVTTSGLNYALPYPIGKVEKVSVTRINKEEFGFSNDKLNPGISLNDESLMLTGDENIADIDFEVQWKVGDVKNYLFNVVNPKQTIRKATESAMREIIAKRPIDDVLANKKSEIEVEVRNLLQNILDSYDAGVDILLVQLLRVDPPEQVINAFRDVQTAKADKERKINEAESYTNDVIPRARGEAEKIILEAEAYKQSIIANAKGESERFISVYNEYIKSKDITKIKMYIETMEEIMSNTDKILIDDSLQKGVLPLLPLDNKTK